MLIESGNFPENKYNAGIYLFISFFLRRSLFHLLLFSLLLEEG